MHSHKTASHVGESKENQELCLLKPTQPVSETDKNQLLKPTKPVAPPPSMSLDRVKKHSHKTTSHVSENKETKSYVCIACATEVIIPGPTSPPPISIAKPTTKIAETDKTSC